MAGDQPQNDWDDIHFDLEQTKPATPDPEADDEIDESRTFDTDEGLESSVLKPEDDDDDLPAGGNPAKKGGDDEPPVADNMTGIELYLSQFEIEAGMIQFEDGTSAHFNDLDPAKQSEVLQQLHSAQAKTVEEQYGLDQNEIGLVNYLRSNNLTVEQMIDNMVQEKLTSVLSMQDLAQEDYSKMEPDALYIKFIKETSPEATPDQIASDLAKAKELSNFSKITENLRTQFVEKQAAIVKKSLDDAKASKDALIEEQRQEIVNSVLPMTQIAGITLDTTIKNTVLDHILQTNEEGDSAFMDEIFSEPESLFKAAFWYVYGEALVAQRDEFWKKEKSAAYKRGKEDALGISQTEKPGKTFVKPGTTSKTEPHTSRPVTRKPLPEDDDDWSSLHT